MSGIAKIRVNAACASLAPYLVFRTVAEIKKQFDRKPAKAVLHPAQSLSWINCANAASALAFDPTQFPDLESQITMAGVPIEQRIEIDKSLVIFLDENGLEMARIEQLAIPTEFES